MANIATIPVGPAPSGLRANPALKQIWGVSTEGGYAFVIDAPTGHVAARIPVGASPFAVDFSQDGARAFVAASGSSTLRRHRLPHRTNPRPRPYRPPPLARARHPRRQTNSRSQSR